MSDQQVLIIESGGSHWDMALMPLQSDHPKGDYFKRLPGYNPNTHPIDELKLRLKHVAQIRASKLKKVVFYCAGLQEGHKAEIEECFRQSISFESVKLHSDLVAIGHAAAPGRKTHVGILGTGSNLASWSGDHIEYTIAALGYLIGDEGSSKHITKEIVKRYFRKQYSPSIMEVLDDIIGMNYEEFVYRVYQKNQWHDLLHQWMSEFKQIWNQEEIIVTSKYCIDQYFNQVVIPTKPENLIITGGIASSYKEYICNQWGEDHRMNLQIVDHLIPGLIEYHSI